MVGMAGFEPAHRADTRVLFRVEPERPRGRVVLLVQSEIAPQWARAYDRFWGERMQAEVKELRTKLAERDKLIDSYVKSANPLPPTGSPRASSTTSSRSTSSRPARAPRAT